MKFKNFSLMLTILFISTIVLTSCNNDKKEAEKLRVETEKAEMETAKKAEQEKKAIQEKEDAMREEARANSISGMAMKNNELATLVTALKAADMETMFSEPGNYTVFAPSNSAFEKLPKAQREALFLPENKEALVRVLQYHVVPGKITSDQLTQAIKSNKGNYKVKTVKGEELTFSMNGDQIVIKDGAGKKAQVILGNQLASNGIVYVIDAVLMAKK